MNAFTHLASKSNANQDYESAAPGVKESELRIKGRPTMVPSVEIDGQTVVATGQWLRVAEVRDEELVDGSTMHDPNSFIRLLRTSGLGADIFTFAQRLPDVAAKYGYHKEYDSIAAVPITAYSQWWKHRTEYSVRKGVNRAKKLGVVAKVVDFSDELLEGMCRIYNETPVRQGKKFWHFGKDVQSIRCALATFLERSVFVGAYYQEHLIGFMKLTWVGSAGVITQILSMKQHFDKRPNNLMIAKGVELCEQNGKSYFIYGKFVYLDPDSSLTEFKRRSGFESISVPRYYIPLTFKGRLAVRLRLYRGILGSIPKPVLHYTLKMRKIWLERQLERPAKAKAAP